MANEEGYESLETSQPFPLPKFTLKWKIILGVCLLLDVFLFIGTIVGIVAAAKGSEATTHFNRLYELVYTNEAYLEHSLAALPVVNFKNFWFKDKANSTYKNDLTPLIWMTGGRLTKNNQLLEHSVLLDLSQYLPEEHVRTITSLKLCVSERANANQGTFLQATIGQQNNTNKLNNIGPFMKTKFPESNTGFVSWDYDLPFDGSIASRTLKFSLYLVSSTNPALVDYSFRIDGVQMAKMIGKPSKK